jgi:hypothetical protein
MSKSVVNETLHKQMNEGNGVNMEGQEGLLSRDHNRLLSFATWAKNLAWAVLLIFTLWAVSDFFGQQNLANVQFFQVGPKVLTFSEMFQQYPAVALRIVLEAVSILFKGVVYYLVLTGISLGLNMIV